VNPDIFESDDVKSVWTGNFLNPERKSCGLKNIRIRVDGALKTIALPTGNYAEKHKSKRAHARTHVIATLNVIGLTVP